LILIQSILALLNKDLILEWRQKYAVNGIMLYVLSTTFVCYLSFRIIDHPATWNALFWIIILFASTNAVSKSFIQENPGRLLYLYTLASPQAIIISKIIYNVVLVTILSLITYVFYSLFIGNLVTNQFLFISIIILGSFGFSSVLTFVSAIASKTNNNVTLMAILSFPILMPLILTLLKVSKNAVDGLDPSISYKYLGVLLFINIIVTALSYLLFPYIWRD